MDAYYQQWGMEDDGDPVVSGWWTAALFEKASFGCLAWKGDELFGAAVGHARSMKKLELGSSWKSSVVWAQEAVDKLGAEAMALLDEISICNRRLAQRAQADGRRFAAELDFLWVSPKARGMGLSKRLLTEVHAVMRAHGAQEYALFTDNYCDYSFYQRKPWEKIGEMIWPSPKWAGSSRSFMFARRINIALSSAKATPRRVIIEVPDHGYSDATGIVTGERWEQHLAVLLLDAFCLSFV